MRRRDHVVDGVDRGVRARACALEAQEAVAPVEGAQAERQLVVPEDLRRVDRQVAAGVDRGPEDAQIDITADLGAGRRCRERDTEDRDHWGQEPGSSQEHGASGTG